MSLLEAAGCDESEIALGFHLLNFSDPPQVKLHAVDFGLLRDGCRKPHRLQLALFVAFLKPFDYLRVVEDITEAVVKVAVYCSHVPLDFS